MPALQYNADVERYRFLMRWKHTVLPMITRDPIFWMMMTTHIVIVLAQQAAHGQGTELPPLNWKAASTLASLLTFFVVFYGGQCYNRYYDFYHSCTGLVSTMGEWAYLIRAHFDASPSNVKWNILRLMLAAMEIQLANLGGTDDQGSKGMTESEWAALRHHNFLSRDEIERLKRYRGARSFLPAVWALAEVRNALKSKLARVNLAVQRDREASAVQGPDGAGGAQQPPALPASELTPSKVVTRASPVKKPSAAQEHEAEQSLLHTPAAMLVFEDFEQCVMRFKMHCGKSLNLLKMPVPFAYYHVLKVLLIVSLALTSYALVELEEDEYVLSTLVFTVICGIMIGLQAVAVAMSDPFGSDDLDFDLDKMLASAYENAVALISDQRLAHGDRLPLGMLSNPLSDNEASKRLRTWQSVNSGAMHRVGGGAAATTTADEGGGGHGGGIATIARPDEATVAASPTRGEQVAAAWVGVGGGLTGFTSPEGQGSPSTSPGSRQNGGKAFSRASSWGAADPGGTGTGEEEYPPERPPPLVPEALISSLKSSGSARGNGGKSVRIVQNGTLPPRPLPRPRRHQGQRPNSLSGDASSPLSSPNMERRRSACMC